MIPSLSGPPKSKASGGSNAAVGGASGSVDIAIDANVSGSGSEGAIITADTDLNVAKEAAAAPPQGDTRNPNLAGIHAVPTVGDRVGKYVVDRVIGSGGMGLVVAARHEALGELVAIKLLRPKAAGDKVHAERFAREARSMIKIKSEHVVRVLDAGTLESGAPYIVMEYLVGRDLAQLLRAEGPIDLQRAADLMLQVCEAVSNAHAVGVVHRDLKPSNFFVTERPDGTTLVKVLDFGISKAIGTDGIVDPNLTETQAVFGSPTYMSPEQIRSAKHVDHRSDVWSLGVALYESTTGKLPFAADNVAGLLASIVADPPYYPRGFAPHLPQAFEELLLAALAKDPAQRVQSVADLAFRLAPYASPNVETHGLVERIARLTNRAVPAALSTTTGPVFPGMLPPGPPSSPNIGVMSPSMPGVMPPAGFQQVPHDARTSGVAFGSTGMDLSAEARPARGNVAAAIAVGLGAALLIVVGAGAYHLRTRPTTAPMMTASPTSSAESTAVTSANSANTTAPPAPLTSTSTEPSSTSGSPKAVTSSTVRKGSKHNPPPKGPGPGQPAVAPAPKTVDPTTDRY
jgi:eukaryotic-like serine/threonine-protein kinase